LTEQHECKVGEVLRVVTQTKRKKEWYLCGGMATEAFLLLDEGSFRNLNTGEVQIVQFLGRD